MSIASFLRRGKAPLSPTTLARSALSPSLDDAYRALATLQGADPSQWGGWKLGGTNHGSRQAFNVDRLYYGAIDHDEILAAPAIAPGFALPELKGEVEVALRLDAAMTGYDAWCVALEMPASNIQNLLELGVIALVSDRCAAGALLLGPVRAGRLPDLSGARFAQRINGETLGEAGLDALVGEPEALLAEFLALARAHGASLRPGQWVATGGITPCLPYAAGDRVEILMDGAVELDVAIQAGSQGTRPL